MNDREKIEAAFEDRILIIKIEAEASKTADELTQDITLLFGKKQLELIHRLIAKGYVTGKVQAKLEEIEGVLK